jgi:predicted DNA-binding WGR domain protein
MPFAESLNTLMTCVYLQREDLDNNIRRFYNIHVTQTLFGDWAIVKEWGRIGSPGTVREEWFDSEEIALSRLKSLLQYRANRGYKETKR